jgi:hypothetical protein
MNTQIIEVLQLFQKMRTVVVSRGLDDNATAEAPDDIILSRLTFLQHAVSVSSLSAPLSSLITVVPALGWVDTRETLDIVLQSMLITGFEEVGVMEGGIMTGVLHVDEIFSFLAKELAWACPDIEASAAKTQRGEVDEASILAETRWVTPSASAPARRPALRRCASASRCRLHSPPHPAWLRRRRRSSARDPLAALLRCSLPHSLKALVSYHHNSAI